MRATGLMVCALVGMVVAGACVQGAAEPPVFPVDRAVDEYFWAEQLYAVQTVQKKEYTPQDRERCGVTHLSAGVEDVRVEDGALMFRVTREEVVLGWGNYQGDQPIAEREAFWLDNNRVLLRVRQSVAQTSQWQARMWSDGKRLSATERNVDAGFGMRDELEGTEWVELEFKEYAANYGAVQQPIPDGFEVTIRAQPGTEIAIERVSVGQPRVRGWFRKEFQLPEGEVWRAIVNASTSARLYVNGQFVDRTNGLRLEPPKWGWETLAADIGPYLREGTNCIGLYGSRIGPTEAHCPFFYLQGEMILESGEVVRLGTDETWRYSTVEEEGWSEPGFDDGDWRRPERTSPPSYLHRDKPQVPAYAGALLIERPGGGNLFFSTDESARLDVRIPPGLGETEPVLHWRLYAEQEEGRAEVASGTVDQAYVQRNGVVYRVDLGQRERGVYSIGLVLMDEDDVLGWRAPEPLMVTGPIDQVEVAGDTYTEGLDLELEETIDFTDPRDPRPWLETGLHQDRNPYGIEEARVVENEGLTYRETAGPGQIGDAFMYRFEFEHPGSFYMIEVDYPNDAERFNGYAVTRISPYVRLKDSGTFVKSSTGEYAAESASRVLTGLHLPLTDTMETFRFIHMADSGVHVFVVMNALVNHRAAAAGVRIYRIRGNLPALDVPEEAERHLGIHTERTHIHNGFGNNLFAETNTQFLGEVDEAPSGYGWTREFQPGPAAPMRRMIQDLIQFQRACENYAQYLRFCGQNFHVIATVQYSEWNTPYEPPPGIATSRVPRCIKSVAAEVFARNGVSFVAGVEYACHKSLVYGPLGNRTDLQVAQGADTIWLMERNGQQYGSWRRRLAALNYHHPVARHAFRAIVDDLVVKFGHLPNFRGVQFLLYPTELVAPTYNVGRNNFKPILKYSYDDHTFVRFERETGIDVPVSGDDPERFEKRYRFATSPERRSDWIDWRCRSMHEFFENVQARVRADHPALQTYVQLYLDTTHIKDWTLEHGGPYVEYIRLFGYDPRLYQDNEDMYFGRWMMTQELHHEIRYTGKTGKKPWYATYWRQHMDPEVLRAYDHPRNRSVVIMNQWAEHRFQSPPGKAESEAWAPQICEGRFHPQATGDFYKEPWAQAMIGSDPDLLLVGYTDANLCVGSEQQEREYARVLLRLPKDKFAPVLGTGLGTNFAIRDLHKDGQYYFYVVNPGYWPISGSIRVDNAEGAVLDLVSGEPAPRTEDGARVLVSLSPYGIAAFRVPGENAKVVDWSTNPISTGQAAHVRNLVNWLERAASRGRELDLLNRDESWWYAAFARAARDALQAGNAARAWQMVTDWRVWAKAENVAQALDRAQQYSARLPGTAPQEAQTSNASTLTAVEVGAPLEVDGALDEDVWGRAPEVRGFVSQETGESSPVETSVRVAYGPEAVYFGFACADPNPEAISGRAQTEEDFFRLEDDAMVLFLQADTDSATYYQMGVSAAGNRFDQRATTSGGRDYAYAPDWQAAAAKTAFGWTAEAAIPYAAFGLQKPGRKPWRVNFHRLFRGGELSPSSWSPTGKSWHRPDRFGRLAFR